MTNTTVALCRFGIATYCCGFVTRVLLTSHTDLVGCCLILQKLAEVERLLLAKKPWPAFLLVESDALGEWENCQDVVKGALEWMATLAVGMIDIASVEPLIPICRAFKALVEAAGGAAESDNKLAE